MSPHEYLRHEYVSVSPEIRLLVARCSCCGSRLGMRELHTGAVYVIPCRVCEWCTPAPHGIVTER